MQAPGEWFISFLNLSSCLSALGTKASLICLHPKKELQGLLPGLGSELGFPPLRSPPAEVLDLRAQAVVAGHLLTGDVGMLSGQHPLSQVSFRVYRFTLARDRRLSAPGAISHPSAFGPLGVSFRGSFLGSGEQDQQCRFSQPKQPWRLP